MGYITALVAEIFSAHVRHPQTDIWDQESKPNLAESIPLNRFLGSLNVYKHGL
jgi:hypothetical protein